jgi:hypothetical protein
MAKQTLPISERSLIRRINRKLAEADQVLRMARGERAKRDVGEFYVVDTRRNFIVSKHIDLVMFAREMGALKPWEHVYALSAAGERGREEIEGTARGRR